MSEEARRSKLARFTPPLPDVVVDAIETVATELSADANPMSVVSALQARGLDYIHCIAGVIVLTDLSLGEAKILVHRSEAFASGRDDREAMWEAMHTAVMTPLGVEYGSTAGDPDAQADGRPKHGPNSGLLNRDGLKIACTDRNALFPSVQRGRVRLCHLPTEVQRRLFVYYGLSPLVIGRRPAEFNRDTHRSR